MGKWPIDTNYGWMIQTIYNSQGTLCGIYSNVKVTTWGIIINK